MRHKEEAFFEEGAESQIANILSALSELKFANDDLNSILFECLAGKEF